jgi:hypothetical protein
MQWHWHWQWHKAFVALFWLVFWPLYPFYLFFRPRRSHRYAHASAVTYIVINPARK